MTLLREIRKATRPKKLVHYAVLLCVMWISYRFYAALQGDDGKSRSKAYGPRDIGLGRGRGPGRADDSDYDDVGQRFENLDDRLKDLHNSNNDHNKRRDNVVVEKARPAESRDGGKGKPQEDNDILQDADGALQVDDNEFDPENGIHDQKKPKDSHFGSAREGQQRLQQQQQQQFQEDERKFKPVKNSDDDIRFSDVDKDAGADADDYGDSMRFKASRRKAKSPAAAVQEKFLGLAKQKAREFDAINFPSVDGHGKPAAAVRQKFDQRVKQNRLADDDTFRLGPKPQDWALEEEMQKRRRKYMAHLQQLAEPYNPKDFENMQEKDEHLAFVTAFIPTTRWRAILQLIHSVQRFYPESPIGIFDLGLSQEQTEKLETFCGVTVHPSFQKLWPPHLKDVSKNLWRPMIWQMGLATYGHIVYVEPERFLMKKKVQEYIEYSLRKGIVVVGRKEQYSPYVVTHPEMYHFLNVDTRKLQRTKMFEITMLVMHNAEPVRHELMRHLMSCALEEYCISPPGASRECDSSFFPNSKKYAHCHRYDLSAVNILINKWFSFNQDEFLTRDVVTSSYDGKDVSSKIKICSQSEKVRQEI